MAQQVQCRHCQMVINVPPELAGKSGKCPGCGKAMEFPQSPAEGQSAEVPPAAPPPPPPTEKGMTWKTVALIAGVGCGGLVVILLIPLGFLLPAMSKAQESARRAQCLSNIRMITLAMIQYAGEYDDDFPSALVDENEAAQRRFARLLKLGYLSTAKVFKCPSASYTQRPDMTELDGVTLMGSSLASIADVYLNDDWCSYGVDPMVNHTHSASRAVIADRPHSAYWGTGLSSPAAGQEGSNSQNHGGDGQNIVYNDGHVKWSPTCKDDVNIDPNIYASNPSIDSVDDSNIDFGKAP